MGRPARKDFDVATPYDTEPRKLFYRPHIRYLYFSLVGLAVTLGSFVLLGAVSLLLVGKAALAVGFILISGILPVVLGLEAWFLMRPLAYSYVQLFPQHLHLQRIKQVIDIPYAEITKIEFSYLPYTVGWFVLHAEGRKPLRFTVVMERSEVILDTIAVHRPELFDQDRLLKYRRTAIYCDHSWARLYDKARAWHLVLAKYLFFPIVAALLSSAVVGATAPSAIFGLSVRYLFMNFAIGYAFYMMEEFQLARSLRAALLKAPAALERKPKLEAQIQRKFQILYYGFTITLFLVLALLTLR